MGDTNERKLDARQNTPAIYNKLSINFSGFGSFIDQSPSPAFHGYSCILLSSLPSLNILLQHDLSEQGLRLIQKEKKRHEQPSDVYISSYST